MSFEKLINNITPEIHISLKRAIEIGRWPDGRSLTQEQKELCMEAVISFEQRFVDETERVGFIDRAKKEEGEMCDDDIVADPNQEKPLKWT
jgi:uncharacterized protein YeaC (DUF1315 family)